MFAAAGCGPNSSMHVARMSRHAGCRWVWNRVTQGVTKFDKRGSAESLIHVKLPWYTCTMMMIINDNNNNNNNNKNNNKNKKNDDSNAF